MFKKEHKSVDPLFKIVMLRKVIAYICILASFVAIGLSVCGINTSNLLYIQIGLSIVLTICCYYIIIVVLAPSIYLRGIKAIDFNTIIIFLINTMIYIAFIYLIWFKIGILYS